MSRIIKACQSKSEPVCSFDFAEILDATAGDAPGREATDTGPRHESEPDPLLNLESLVQQRLLEAERRAQELEQEGYEKGYAQGLKDGTEFGRKSMQVAKEQFEGLLERLSTLPNEVFEDYRNWFIAACLAVSKHLVQMELQTNPQVLIKLIDGVLNEAEESQGLTLYLHPKDIDLLGSHSLLDDLVEGSERMFAIRPDSQLTRGGCRVESETQLIDATLENRLALIEEALMAEGEAGVEAGEDGSDFTEE